MIKMTRKAEYVALLDFAHQVASAILVLLQESAKQPVELLHKVETLMNLVWERLNTGHWAKVTASPLGRNTHWVLIENFLEQLFPLIVQFSTDSILHHSDLFVNINYEGVAWLEETLRSACRCQGPGNRPISSCRGTWWSGATQVGLMIHL